MSHEDKGEDHSKRPEDTNFKQQRLKAWQPLLTPAYVIATFFAVGVIFVIIGAIIFTSSDKVVEVTQRYDDSCTTLGGTCTVSVTIPKDMDDTVYFYYRLTNFYQNHRRYVKSRSDDQLSGDDIGSVSACDPLSRDGNGVGLYPCGLIANSMFNDSFSFTVTPSGGSASTITPTTTEISWKSDRDKKFKDPGNTVVGGASVPYTVMGYSGNDLTRNLTSGFAIGAPGGVVDTTAGNNGIADEHFIVWMRTAGLPTFKKLWGKFPGGFKKDDVVTVTINHNFPTAAFNGEKAVVFSTTSWLGGKNDFLGIAYLTVGCLCVALGAVFWIKHCVSPRPLGDMQYLNWPGSSAASR